ncbi:MAG: YHYH protein [Candidatus Obscuribacterales bacterium]|nr:YHYH protein [Candidatus Obscuribacterales bacterium]
MTNKTAIIFGALLCLMQQNMACAHYDHSTSIKAKETQKNQISVASTFDPWKLLEFALTPAYASSSQVSITIEGDYRIIRSNGLPDHATGSFPNSGNPNRISEQHYVFRVPLKPVESSVLTPLGMNPFGIAVNGIPFDPGAAEWWQGDRSSGWQYEAMALGPRLGLDQNNAHVQPNGSYHYHGIPVGLLDELSRAPKPVLLGYAADGFPIYGPYGHSNSKDSRSGLAKLRSSYRVKYGSRSGGPQGTYDGLFTQDYEYVKGLGELDECNGRFAVTSEYPQGIYHYVITDTFPFIPRQYKGTPDSTFRRRPPGGRGPGGMHQHPPGGPGRPGFHPPDGPPRFDQEPPPFEW